MVALRKVNFNQIPKIIPKIPVSIIKQSVLWKTWLLSRKSEWDSDGPGKRGHIIAHVVSWAAQTGKHLLRTQHVSEQNQKHFLCPINVAWAGKRRNICVSNNVSLFARTFMSIEFVMWCLSYPTISHDIQSNYTVQSYNHDKDTLLLGLKSGLTVLANHSRLWQDTSPWSGDPYWSPIKKLSSVLSTVFCWHPITVVNFGLRG